jgi:hypothetical protein
MAGSIVVKEFLDNVWLTHQLKNADYSEAGHMEGGDVFSNFRTAEKVGCDTLTGAMVRWNDKYERVCNLKKKGFKNAVEKEGFEDALLDLAGYTAIIYAIYREEHNGSS